MQAVRSADLSAILQQRAGEGRSRHLAFVCLASGSGACTAEWIEACYRLTPRVERVAASGALLDLGSCTDDEALCLMRTLLRDFSRMGVSGARAGIGPSLSSAQLAVLAAPAQGRLALVTQGEAAAFLRAVPAGALAQLHPRGLVSAGVIERMERFGLRTLGHVARVEETALRRQFGDAIGGFLAAVAAGRDDRALCPTPPAPRQRMRVRFTPAAQPERVAAALPVVAGKVEAHLRRQGQRGRQLALGIRWESGGIQEAGLTLRRHTRDAAILAQELDRLFRTLVRPDGAVEALRITLGDFAPVAPEQVTFWPVQAQRLAAVQTIADMLARRHGRPLLLRPRLADPATIFDEERYELAPTGTEGAPSRQLARAPAPAARAGAGWERVPQRLHWW
jgi:impB/mucB/samB family C-terminal domain